MKTRLGKPKRQHPLRVDGLRAVIKEIASRDEDDIVEADLYGAIPIWSDGSLPEAHPRFLDEATARPVGGM